MSAEALSPATARELRRLRLRLAALLAALVLIVVAVFATLVLRLDGQLRDEQNDAELLRALDAVSTELNFDDELIEPEDPRPLLGDSVVLGVQPDFDVLDVLEREDLWERIPEPDDDQIEDLARDAFLDLDIDEQDAVLDEVVVGDGTRAQRLERLLADPTDSMVDEAYRVYLIDQAEARDIELDSPIRIWPQPGLLAEPEAARAIDRVLEDDEIEFVVESNGRRLQARGALLRDGAETRGAAVALIDLDETEQAKRDLRNQVLIVAASLVGLAALAAWMLAGRSIRPAAAALGQQERFLSAAAHELRTPVAAIRATAEAPVGADQAPAQLDRVAELAAGASVLTDDLLTLARMDADRLELQTTPTRLDYLVESIIDGDPAYRLVASPVVVDGDVSLLTRAIDNLLRNARVHGEASPEKPAQVIVDARGVVVSDRGSGIDPAERDRVFERFRSGAASPGHGLGLALARWIARSHGGDLTIEPSVEGATFRLTLAGLVEAPGGG